MDDADRRAALRIKALLDKTVANGCTEAEALAAAAKAAELLSRHGLDAEGVRRVAEGYAERLHRNADAVGRRLWDVADAIAGLCHVRCWVLGHDPATGDVAFFGPSVDVEVASYLLDIAERAMRGALAGFVAGNALKRPDWVRAKSARFLDAMSARLAERISDIAWTRRRTPEGEVEALGRLVRVDAEAERRGIAARECRTRARTSAEPATLRGLAAADAVTLEAAVGGRRKSASLVRFE